MSGDIVADPQVIAQAAVATSKVASRTQEVTGILTGSCSLGADTGSPVVAAAVGEFMSAWSVEMGRLEGTAASLGAEISAAVDVYVGDDSAVGGWWSAGGAAGATLGGSPP